jgi:hypothetical protein
MTRTARRRLSLPVSGLLILVAIGFGPSGCQNTLWIFPEDSSVQQGPFDVQVYWSPEMIAPSLRVSMNNQEITGNLAPAVELDGVLGMMLDTLPGRKLLSAQIHDSYGIPYVAASIFTATSKASRETFPGGLLTFECENSFLNSPIQIPGLDLDLGLSEAICEALPIIGLFPSGDSAFPVGSELPPVLFGVFPRQVTYDVDTATTNGISLSPVELGVSFDFDPADPAKDGKVCRASFVMAGTILPGRVSSLEEQGPPVMVQSLREVSLSLVSGGQCEHLFTSPADRDIMTFNYVARQ